MSDGDLHGGVLGGFFEGVVPTVALTLLGTITAVVWLQVGTDPVIALVTMAAVGVWGFLLRLVAAQDVPAGVQLVSQTVLGGLFGLLVGVYAVRARESAETATQERLEREFAERQQETNEVLNRILRQGDRAQ